MCGLDLPEVSAYQQRKPATVETFAPFGAKSVVKTTLESIFESHLSIIVAIAAFLLHEDSIKQQLCAFTPRPTLSARGAAVLDARASSTPTAR